MGGSESAPVVASLPPVCKVQRKYFQDKLLDINAVYNLMKHYQLTLTKLYDMFLENNNLPASLPEELVVNFKVDAIERIRKRSAANNDDNIDSDLYNKLKVLPADYSSKYSSAAKFKVIKDIIEQCYLVMVLYTKNMYELCSTDSMDAYGSDIQQMLSNNEKS